MSLLDLLDRPIAFHRCFADLCGGNLNAALMLSQSFYWQKVIEKTNSGKIIEGRKYFWKIQSEWQTEIGISEKQQVSARKCLKKHDFWLEKQKGIPKKLYYRVDLIKLEQALLKLAKSRNKSPKNDEKNEQNQQSPAMGDSCIPQSGIQESPKAGHYPEISSEISSEKTTPPIPPPGESGGGFLSDKNTLILITEYIKLATKEKAGEIKDLAAYKASLMRRIRRQGGLSGPDQKQLKCWKNKEDQDVTPPTPVAISDPDGKILLSKFLKVHPESALNR